MSAGRADVASQLPVVVIGAGPVGLAAAAHLLERGLEPLVLEAGDQVGAAIREWGHVRLFSPWRYDVDPAAARLLEQGGWESPDRDQLPTGAELVDSYLAPLAATPQLAPRVRTGVRAGLGTLDHNALRISTGCGPVARASTITRSASAPASRPVS